MAGRIGDMSGAVISVPILGRWEVQVADPDGNRFHLGQRLEGK
jgi:hypothetical protein